MSKSSRIIDGLKTNTLYAFHVRAKNTMGVWSVLNTVGTHTTLKDTTTPAVLSSITLLLLVGVFSLKWVKPSTLDLRGGGYKVYVFTSNLPASAVLIREAGYTSDSIIISIGEKSQDASITITAGTTYFFWVTTLDASGNESAKVATTPASGSVTAAASATDLTTHAGLTTGVHGVGASTIASVANIATHAALSASIHGVSASGFEDKANKAVASGYCDLDASVLVPLARIPATLTGKDADTLDTYHAASFSLTGHNHSGVYEPVITAGTTAQYWRGDKSWQTLNQASVAGLTTTDAPQFRRIGLGAAAAAGVALTISGTLTSTSYAMGLFFTNLTLNPGNNQYAVCCYMGAAVVADAGEVVSVAAVHYLVNLTKSGTGTITVAYGMLIGSQTIGTTNWGIYVAGNNSYFGGDVNVTGVIKVDNVQVVGNRVVDARCDDVINSGDATTDGVIDALRDAMISHGLIAAA